MKIVTENNNSLSGCIEYAQMNNIKEGYKETELGLIPVDWNSFSFKEISKLSQGLCILIQNRFKDYDVNRLKYITLQYVQSQKSEDLEYIDAPKATVTCTKDDILVTRTGSGVGKIVTNVEGAFHNNFLK